MSFKPEELEVAAKAEFEAFMESSDMASIRNGYPDSAVVRWEDMSDGVRESWRDGVHRPQRGDAVERWLKAKRDAEKDCWGETEHYRSFDLLLDEYRLRADTGLLLSEDIALADPNALEHTRGE